MEKKYELKPCPFCGGEADILKLPGYTSYAVGCAHTYGCKGTLFSFHPLHQSAETAANAWNKRAPAPPKDPPSD